MFHTFTVTVACDTPEQADHVIAERLDHDEDYGFTYGVSYRREPQPEPPHGPTESSLDEASLMRPADVPTWASRWW